MAASNASGTSVAGPTKYEPLPLDPQEFSDLMPELFDLYWSYPPDAFLFDFLQRTSDLKVVCKDATAEKVYFPTPPAIEKAIQNSTRINFPDTSSYPLDPPADDNWTSWMEATIYYLSKGIDIPHGETE
ncbi:hypothetical protein AJ79_06692 [Helicocarpus griseus UAMH5409]|uniref:Uncharacterized protein n=1 Tax=Helicocarpus griseus UAMH5409 TaxID=1447875 RepID=A0A2B7XAE4_9EURO|nr:hypothetical protein AJ79_06692 [Helicocarpus griseus UAMH5409]